MPKRKHSEDSLNKEQRIKRPSIMKHRSTHANKSLKDLGSSEMLRVQSALDAAALLVNYKEDEEDAAEDRQLKKICGRASAASAATSRGSVIWDRKKRKRLATAMKLLEFVEGNLDGSGSDVDWADEDTTVRAMGRLLPGDYFGVCEECRSRCRSCGRRSSRCVIPKK